jgi:hypothetical protein
MIGRLEQWVSVKILRADLMNQSRELDNCRAIAEIVGASPSSGYFVHILDEFLHVGPNGCHQCLVFALLGPAVVVFLRNLFLEGALPNSHTVLGVTARLLHAVDYMHSIGYAHGGTVLIMMLATRSISATDGDG